MKICIRNAKPEDYSAVEKIMRQVQKMHIDWRPDIYKDSETIFPLERFEQAVQENAFFVAECEEEVVGALSVVYRHIENPSQVTRDIIYVDSLAVEEHFRGRGIGHAFFDFLKELKDQKGYDGIELQVNAKNKAAYKMYAGYGFTVKSVSMELL